MSLHVRADNCKDKKMGDAPIIRTPKPVKSIGRDTARIYCPRCGRKRNVCKCEESGR